MVDASVQYSLTSVDASVQHSGGDLLVSDDTLVQVDKPAALSGTSPPEAQSALPRNDHVDISSRDASGQQSAHGSTVLAVGDEVVGFESMDAGISPEERGAAMIQRNFRRHTE